MESFPATYCSIKNAYTSLSWHHHQMFQREKRGRPRKYTSTKAKQVSNVTQWRNRRQSARAVHCCDQHYSTTVPLSTDINESPSTYFPPGELSIATEVEQLLPSLSPDLGPWEPSMLEIRLAPARHAPTTTICLPHSLLSW